MAYVNEADVLCGVERWPRSELHGQVVCEKILIWDKPVTQRSFNDLAGVLRHGEAVQVKEKKVHGGRNWYRVEHENGISGWVLAPFLERLGEVEAKLGSA